MPLQKHLRVQLQDEMVSSISRTKLKVYNTVNSQLLDVFQAPCSQMLSQLQGEVAGCVAFFLLILQQHDTHYLSTLGDSLCVIGAIPAFVPV